MWRWSKEQGLRLVFSLNETPWWVSIWAKWDSSAQFVRKVGKSALEWGKTNSIIPCATWCPWDSALVAAAQEPHPHPHYVHICTNLAVFSYIRSITYDIRIPLPIHTYQYWYIRFIRSIYVQIHTTKIHTKILTCAARKGHWLTATDKWSPCQLNPEQWLPVTVTLYREVTTLPGPAQAAGRGSVCHFK